MKRALERAPESVPSLISAAKYYLARGRLDDSNAMLETAQAVAPENTAVLLLRATWAVREGSRVAMNAAAELLMNGTVALDPGLLIRATELYLRAGNGTGADECLAQIDSRPLIGARFDVQIQTLRGARAYLRGEYYTAINHLRTEAGKISPAPWARRLLAAAYAKSGDLDTAYDIYKNMVVARPSAVEAKLQLAELAWQRGRIDDVRETVNFKTNISAAHHAKADLIRFVCDIVDDERDSAPARNRSDDDDAIERFRSAAGRDAYFNRWLGRSLVYSGHPGQAADLILNAGASADLTDPGADLGALLLAQGYALEALSLADQLIERQPEALVAHVLRIIALGDLDRLPEASAAVEHFNGTDSQKGRLLEALADAYSRNGHREMAVATLREATNARPNDIGSRRKLIRLTERLDEASVIAEQIRSIEGDDGFYWKHDLAEALLRLDPTEESLSRAKQLLVACRVDRPTRVPIHLLCGYACELMGELQNAADAYRMAVELDPGLRTRPMVVRLIGVLGRLGQQREADALLGVLAAALPDEPAVLRLMTQQRARQRDFDSALSFAERLLELHPEDPDWVATTADLLLRLGRPHRAESMARSALESHPGSIPVLWSVARALLAQKRVDAAENIIRTAVRRTNDAAMHLLLARFLIHIEKATEAESEIRKAQERAPDDPVVWAACADIWGSMGRRERRIECARTSIQLRGEPADRSLRLATLLLADGTRSDIAEAGTIIDRCLQTNPKDSEALILHARRELAAETPDYVAAERIVRQALAQNPRSVEGYRILTDICVRLAKFKLAVELAHTGLALAPDDATLLLAAGELNCFLGEYRKAIPTIHRLLRIKPRLFRGLELLATAYRVTGRMSDAIQLIERQTSTGTRSVGEVLILAQLLEWNGDTQAAKTLFLQAANTDRESGRSLQQMLLFLERQGDFQLVLDHGLMRRADHPHDYASLAVAGEILGSRCKNPSFRETGLGWLEEIARKDTDHAPNAIYRAGLCFYKCGQFDRAEERFLRAIVLAPRFSEPVNALAWMYTEDLDRPSAAAAIVDVFLERGGVADAKLSDTHAVAFLRLGDLDNAKERLEYCLRRAGQTSTLAAAHYHLGLVLRANGDISNAVSNIRIGLALANRLGGLTDQERLHARGLISGGASTDH